MTKKKKERKTLGSKKRKYSNKKQIRKKNQMNVTFGSTVVNQIVFMSLLHMPLGKVCQQGKDISIIKQTDKIDRFFFLFHTVTETVREEKSITLQLTTPPPNPTHPHPPRSKTLEKIGNQSLLHRNIIATWIKSNQFFNRYFLFQ